MRRLPLMLSLAWAALSPLSGEAASFLFDATHAETAGNADWVIDEDSSPQRLPTPAQSTVTATTPETYWTGALSAWGIALVQRGHHVETLPTSGGAITYKSATNAQDLSKYQVFVVDEPNTVFTAAEQTAIVSWVKAGGSLFLIADHGNSDRNNDGYDSVQIWNALFASNSVQAAPFGITFNGDSISPTAGTCDTAASDPITHGKAGTITKFVYAAGSSMTLDPSKNASVKGAVWTSSTHGNTNVQVAYGTFGYGKFVAVGDSSPFDDGTGASGNTLYDGWTDGGGNNGQLTLNACDWLTLPPANDAFASATLLSGNAVSATGANLNATKETGEPNHAGGAGGASVWWSWTASAAGSVTLDTNGSAFDTLLAVYTGTAINALTAVASDDNSGPNSTSKVTFAVAFGTVYRIAVDGVAAAGGTIALNLAFTPAPIPVVTIAATIPDAYEAGTKPGSVTVTSSLAAGAGGLAVQYQVGGTATFGTDYSVTGNSASGVLTIPAGKTTAILTLNPVDDTNVTEFNETANFTLAAGAGYPVGSPASATVTIHDHTPYKSTWAANYPGFSGASAAPLADPDQDGISNLLEFAFDGNPSAADPAILPSIGRAVFADPNDGNTLKTFPTITFRRRTDAANLTYTVESSLDLAGWSAGAVQRSTVPGPTPQTETVTYSGPTPLDGMGAAPTAFLRVRVTAN